MLSTINNYNSIYTKPKEMLLWQKNLLWSKHIRTQIENLLHV